MSKVRTCRVCGCTNHDCQQCIAKIGEPCEWLEADLCSACVTRPAQVLAHFHPVDDPHRHFTVSFETDLTPGHEKQLATKDAERVLKEVGLHNMTITRTTHTYNLKQPMTWPFT